MIQRRKEALLGPPSLCWTGVSPPGARYFSHAGKVPKSALRCPLRRTLAPFGGTALIRSPLRTPGRDAPSVDWCVVLLRSFGRGGGNSRTDKGILKVFPRL